MITKESLATIRETKAPEAARHSILTLMKGMKVRIGELEQAYDHYRFDGTVQDSIDELIESIGYDAAKMTIATAINSIHPADGRIFPSTRRWAEAQPNAIDYHACQDLYISTRIHPANMNQLGMRMADTPHPNGAC